MNELATIQTGLTLQPKEITLNQVQIAQTMGELAYKSGIFKAPKPEAVAMIMLKGYELGFPMTAAAEFIQVIEGTVGLTPRGALAIMKSHPDVIHSVELTEIYQDDKYYGCRCTIVRIEDGRGVPYSKTFTLDDAQRAGLAKPSSNWEKYPQQMCQWRALGFCADIACPDLLAGLTGLMKMPEVIENDRSSILSEESFQPVVEDVVVEPKQKISLTDLLARYGAEKILAVNNGAMPKNEEECEKIAELLGEN